MPQAIENALRRADDERHVACLLTQVEDAWKRCVQYISKPPKFKKKGYDRLTLCEPSYNGWNLGGLEMY